MNPLEKKLKELNDSVESYEQRSRRRAIFFSLLAPVSLLTLYLGFIVLQIGQLESKKKQLEARNAELEEQVVKSRTSIESAKKELETINLQIARVKSSSGGNSLQASLSKLEAQTLNLDSKITEAAKTLEKANISNSGVALVFDPPSNVRTTPNGNILCSVRNKTTINIYSSVGDWFYTDVCGNRGVIHRSQIRF